MTWQRRVPALRAVARRSLPELTRARRLPPGLRVVKVAGVLGWGVLPPVLLRRRDAPVDRAKLSARMRRAAERLGPAYIKLGQIISSGEGIFPSELVGEFRKLRDQVPPEPWEVVRQVAASIAQVHEATLLDGTPVVVKVQRPSVSALVGQDLAAMAWLAPFLIGRIPVAALANPPALVELFAETISEELDFRLEAQNMLDVARSLAELGQRSFVVPRPHPHLVTRRVLVMERLDGFRFDDVAGMHAAGVDTAAVVRAGMIALLEGCMLKGIFHGDLHGGNLFVRPDGRTALLDYGITARMTEAERHAFLRLLLSASMNDPRGQLAALRDLGTLPPDTDLDAVARDLGLDQPPVDPTTLNPEQLVKEIQGAVKQLLAYGARMPKVLMLFVKNLVFLDGAIATLAPDLDLFAEISHISVYFATQWGEAIAGELGVDPDSYAMDLDGIKAGFGVDPRATTTLTYRDLQKRRELIRTRLRGREPSSG
jgi:ubiquinone biosynthesis protein